MQLRPYQAEAEEAVYAAYAAGLRRVGVQLFTSAGKTVIFSHMAKRYYERGQRVLIVVHRDTLVVQTIRKLQKVGIPDNAIGVVKGSRNEVGKPVIVASIHTLRNDNRLIQLIPPDLTVIDEAHVSVAPTYMKLYKHIDTIPGGQGHLVGFSATWMRSDSRGLGDIWEKVVYKRSIKWGAENGYLVKPDVIQLGGTLDMSNVRTAANGDWREGDLEEVVMIDDLRDTVVEGYHKLTPNHPAVLFAPTQVSARYFGDALRESGVPVAEIFANTKPAARRWAFHGFDTGAVKILATCTALAEGWDAPHCDTALLLRPTKHLGLFIQQAGRIMRLWPGKSVSWLLDFVGVTDDKTFRAAVDLSLSSESEEVEHTECEECGAFGPTRYIASLEATVCHACAVKLGEAPAPAPDRVAKKIDGIIRIDLFEQETARWLQTEFGVPFVSTRDHIYFIVPMNGGWYVGKSGSKYKLEGGCWLAQGVTSAEAIEIGGEAALQDDPTISHRKAAWRQGERPPTQEQLSYAARRGIPTEGLSKAALSDALNVDQANRTLSIYRKVMAA